MHLKDFLRKNKSFLIPVLIFLMTGIVFLALYTKDQIHLAHNGWYNSGADIFYSNFTHLGDGLVFAPAAIILAFVRWRYLLGLVVVALLVLLVTGFLKKVVFEGEPRPAKYFENKAELRLVEGTEIHHWNSFPSGHTIAGFACLGFLAFLVAGSFYKFLFFLMAANVGYSRMYLSQHFLEDVMAGAFLGTLIAIASYFIMQRFRFAWVDGRLGAK